MAKITKRAAPEGEAEMTATNETMRFLELKSIHDLMDMQFTTDKENEIVQLRPSNKPGLYEFFRVQ